MRKLLIVSNLVREMYDKASLRHCSFQGFGKQHCGHESIMNVSVCPGEENGSTGKVVGHWMK